MATAILICFLQLMLTRSVANHLLLICTRFNLEKIWIIKLTYIFTTLFTNKIFLINKYFNYFLIVCENLMFQNRCMSLYYCAI